MRVYFFIVTLNMYFYLMNKDILLLLLLLLAVDLLIVTIHETFYLCLFVTFQNGCCNGKRQTTGTGKRTS